MLDLQDLQGPGADVLMWVMVGTGVRAGWPDCLPPSDAGGEALGSHDVPPISQGKFWAGHVDGLAPAPEGKPSCSLLGLGVAGMGIAVSMFGQGSCVPLVTLGDGGMA